MAGFILILHLSGLEFERDSVFTDLSCLNLQCIDHLLVNRWRK
ncbi:Uncharacterised protein [Vibrio cholerae]|nr:Uncharacterised protein [Vibrio cholerae]